MGSMAGSKPVVKRCRNHREMNDTRSRRRRRMETIVMSKDFTSLVYIGHGKSKRDPARRERKDALERVLITAWRKLH